MAVLSYRDLRVWQAGMELAEAVYRLTARFPDHERFGLTVAMRRTAVLVPSSIAQGHALDTTKEYLHLVSKAQGHLAELQTQIDLSGRLGYLSVDEVDRTLDQSTALVRQLYALRNALMRDG